MYKHCEHNGLPEVGLTYGPSGMPRSMEAMVAFHIDPSLSPPHHDGSREPLETVETRCLAPSAPTASRPCRLHPLHEGRPELLATRQHPGGCAPTREEQAAYVLPAEIQGCVERESESEGQRSAVHNRRCPLAMQLRRSENRCSPSVQAVPKPPPPFFLQIIRRRSSPLYRHPHLRPIGTPVALPRGPIEAGSISDGDDHEGLGPSVLLSRARGDDGKVGWQEVLCGEAKASMLKRTLDEREEEYIAPPDEEGVEVSGWGHTPSRGSIAKALCIGGAC